MTVDGGTEPLAGLWPLFGLLIQTATLQLRLPRDQDLPALARAARDIAGPEEPRLQMPWMYQDSPAMERQLLQRHWRALAHWRPESWHLPLAVFAGGEPIGIQSVWAEDFARCRSVGTGSWITRARQGRGYGTEARAAWTIRRCAGSERGRRARLACGRLLAGGRTAMFTRLEREVDPQGKLSPDERARLVRSAARALSAKLNSAKARKRQRTDANLEKLS